MPPSSSVKAPTSSSVPVDPTGSGGVKAAAEAGVWGIGVDQDEYFTTFSGGSAPGSEFLASSAIKRVDLAAFRLHRGRPSTGASRVAPCSARRPTT